MAENEDLINQLEKSVQTASIRFLTALLDRGEESAPNILIQLLGRSIGSLSYEIIKDETPENQKEILDDIHDTLWENAIEVIKNLRGEIKTIKLEHIDIEEH